MNNYTIYNSQLSEIESEGNLRSLPAVEHRGGKVIVGGRELVNLSSNDYLSIASDRELRDKFFKTLPEERLLLGATSSRLLSGTYLAHSELERTLEELFSREALTFSSGYGMNCGMLGALVTSRTLILCDKLVHASIIDGVKLSGAKSMRFRHNDFLHLESLLRKYHREYAQMIIVVESIYSMDGDICDLRQLVDIKRRYPSVMLYVDEAHAIGVRGRRGLGVAEEMGVIEDIDILCGTFGKAVGSVGAYVVCDRVIKELFVNKMRSFIFNTALPPLNCEWTRWVLEHLEGFTERREFLCSISKELRDGLEAKGYEMPSESHIVPVMVGDSAKAVALSDELKEDGYYALAVRPPTVRVGTSRLRISLNSSVQSVKRLLEKL